MVRNYCYYLHTYQEPFRWVSGTYICNCFWACFVGSSYQSGMMQHFHLLSIRRCPRHHIDRRSPLHWIYSCTSGKVWNYKQEQNINPLVVKTCGATRNPAFPRTGPDRKRSGSGNIFKNISGWVEEFFGGSVRVGEFYFGSVRVGVFFTDFLPGFRG